jgi:hypothetical protein
MKGFFQQRYSGNGYNIPQSKNPKTANDYHTMATVIDTHTQSQT